MDSDEPVRLGVYGLDKAYEQVENRETIQSRLSRIESENKKFRESISMRLQEIESALKRVMGMIG